jgi:hypothetical protein
VEFLFEQPSLESSGCLELRCYVIKLATNLVNKLLFIKQIFRLVLFVGLSV